LTEVSIYLSYMSHGLLSEEQHAWKSIQEAPGRKEQRPKLLLIWFRKQGLSNAIFKSICGHPAKI